MKDRIEKLIESYRETIEENKKYKDEVVERVIEDLCKPLGVQYGTFYDTTRELMQVVSKREDREYLLGCTKRYVRLTKEIRTLKMVIEDLEIELE